jgi:hypothetical protein
MDVAAVGVELGTVFHPPQDNAEAIAFLATLPIMSGLGFVAFRDRYNALQSPQRVETPFLVRSSGVAIYAPGGAHWDV